MKERSLIKGNSPSPNNVINTSSPYFPVKSPSKGKRRTRYVALGLQNVTPKRRDKSRPGFMILESELPLGPPIDIRRPCTVVLDEGDIMWYEEELERQQDPLYAFNLRLSVYLNRRLFCAKPILIQEKLRDDPWKLLVAVTLLNQTAGRTAIPTFWELVKRWPTAQDLQHAHIAELEAMLQPLGLHKVRGKRLIELSKRATYVFVKTMEETGRAGPVMTLKYPPTPVSHLPGVGAYALDSYRIFCTPGEEWKYVLPTDKELIRWMRWKWAFFERCRWEPDRGAVAPLDKEYLEALPDLLST